MLPLSQYSWVYSQAWYYSFWRLNEDHVVTRTQKLNSSSCVMLKLNSDLTYRCDLMYNIEKVILANEGEIVVDIA